MYRQAIQHMIHLYEGDLLAVNRLEAQCLCATAITAEPSPSCPHCLGTGRKIRLQKIKGVVQESNGPSTMRRVTDCVITKEIFVDEKYQVQIEDLIIFNQEVFKIFEIKTFRLTDNQPVYRILYATPLKYDSHYVIQHLAKLGVI